MNHYLPVFAGQRTDETTTTSFDHCSSFLACTTPDPHFREVQNMLHKRRLGVEGLATLRRFENTALSQWDLGKVNESVNSLHMAST
jgi:hypothetical protein